MELRSLGRYELRGELGRGTMGVVYRGFDPVLERDVALKTVHLSFALDEAQREKYLTRFLHEAKIAAKLLHPNIVVTHDAATEGRVPFIAMELLSGGSLRDRVAGGAIPWRDAMKLVVPIADALDYAHERGIVHRDVKPANVLMTERGVPKLADFGIARLPSAEITESGALMGTPFYMSPEQLESDEIDGRSDIYALGALFYALVAGRPPFTGSDLATITNQVLYKDPLPLSELVPDVPLELDGVVARALAKKRDERYPNGAELARDLERVERGEAPELPLALGERTLPSVPRAASPSPPPEASGREPELRPDPSPQETASASAPVPRRGGGLSGFLVLAATLALVLALGWDAVPRGVRGFLADRRETARRDAVAEKAAQELRDARELASRGHWTESDREVERALELYREAKDGAGEARALIVRGRNLAARGEGSSARTDLDAAVAVAEIYGSERDATAAVVALAELERDLGALDRADALFQRAQDEGAGGEALVGRALLQMLQGELDHARQGLEKVPREDAARARAEVYLGALAFDAGDPEEAELHWSRAAESMEGAEVDLWRGYAALALGRAEEARLRFEAALSRFEAQDHRTGMVSAKEGLEGRTLPSRLGTLFLAEPRTSRGEALALRF